MTDQPAKPPLLLVDALRPRLALPGAAPSRPAADGAPSGGRAPTSTDPPQAPDGGSPPAPRTRRAPRNRFLGGGSRRRRQAGEAK